jgi:YD repeat-containing protein
VVIGRAGAAYDNLGQQYQSISYNQPGTVAMISNTRYDADGNVIRTQDGGTQEFTETVYDGLGNPTTVYDGVGGGEDYSDFATNLGKINVSDQTILTESVATMDAAGDQVFETDYNRLPTAPTTDTGALDSLPGDSQVTYTADWYDGLGRNVAEADYGTNGGAGVPPSGGHAPVFEWDTVNATWQDPSGTAVNAIVSGTSYNAAGYVSTTTDNAGRVDLTEYDDAGRVTETVQNVSTSTGPDLNVTSTTNYGAGDNLANTSQTSVQETTPGDPTTGA